MCNQFTPSLVVRELFWFFPHFEWRCKLNGWCSIPRGSCQRLSKGCLQPLWNAKPGTLGLCSSVLEPPMHFYAASLHGRLIITNLWHGSEEATPWLNGIWRPFWGANSSQSINKHSPGDQSLSAAPRERSAATVSIRHQCPLGDQCVSTAFFSVFF